MTSLRSRRFSPVLLSATALVLIACGSSGEMDAGAADGGHAGHDAGTDGGATPHDAGTDAGRDGGSAVDGGLDAGAADAGAADAGTDAGVEDGGAGTDAGSDAGLDGGPAPDAATPVFSFESPLQVDLGSILDVDTVASSAPSGQSYPPLHAMDGSNYDLFTVSVGTPAGDAAGGVPDDGFYASNADHPDVQLAWSDTSVAPNSVILHEPTGPTEVTFPIVEARFSTLQLYLTSTEGSSPVEVTLAYTDGTMSVATFTVPDWFDPWAASAPVFVLQEGLSRFSAAGIDYSDSAALFGATVDPDPAKTLASVTVSVTSGGRLVLYGATAY